MQLTIMNAREWKSVKILIVMIVRTGQQDYRQVYIITGLKSVVQITMIVVSRNLLIVINAGQIVPLNMQLNLI